MKRSRRNITSLTIGLLIIILIISLFGLVNTSQGNEIFRNKVIKTKEATINYPYFASSIDDVIEKYVKNINPSLVDKTNYEVNIVDKNTSILFTKSKNGEIVSYDSFIFDKDNKITDIKSIVSDEEILKRIEFQEKYFTGRLYR